MSLFVDDLDDGPVVPCEAPDHVRAVFGREVLLNEARADTAEKERNQRVLAADQHFNDTIAQGLTNVIMRHQTFAQMMSSLSNEVVSGLLQNALKSILADDMTKERDAAYAARQAFKAGMQLPFPANVVAAPVMAARGVHGGHGLRGRHGRRPRIQQGRHRPGSAGAG